MTAARPDTWMPIYWGDYRRDTAHLSASEHGAYLLLIGHYWISGNPLPDDDDRLARIASMTPREWKKARPVISEFFNISNGVWRQKRVDAELERANAITEKRRDAANRRWCNDDASAHAGAYANGDAKPDANTDAKAVQNALPSQSQLPKKDISLDFADWYAAYPRHVGRGQALKAYRAARKKADAETLLSAAERFAAECDGKDQTFVPHPATWLNGERWLDEGADGSDEVMAGRLHMWRTQGYWHEDWGPPPDEPEQRRCA